jgi:hypothetical protein
MKMITLLLAPLPIALSLPEVTAVVLAMALVLLIALAMALILAAAVLALVVAMAGTVNTVSSSARKQQNLIKPSAANCVIETPAFRLAMPHFLNKKSRRHAVSPSLDARTSRPWDGRSTRKGSWFTLAAAVLPLNIQKLTMAGTINSLAMAGTVNPKGNIWTLKL